MKGQIHITVRFIREKIGKTLWGESQCDYLPEGEWTCCVYCNNNVVFALTLLFSRFHTGLTSYREREIILERYGISNGRLSEKKHWLICADTGNDGEKFLEDVKIHPTFLLGHFLDTRKCSRSPVPSPAVDTLTRLGQTKRGRAHAGHSSFVAEAYSLFTWSEKQTANQLHSCHRATRRRHKLFMTRQRKGSRMRGK